MVSRGRGYAELARDFRWVIPPRFNIADVCADRWAVADPQRPALIRYDGRGGTSITTYQTLKSESDRFAVALRRRGVQQGDRIAVLLPQSVETVVAHLAAYKLGAIALPLAALFGVEALSYRLRIAGAKVIVTDGSGVAKLDRIEEALPDLEMVLSIDGPGDGAEGFRETLGPSDSAFVPAVTKPDDPALMIFTSGTTGPPKGALHGHRVLIGHLPGITFSHEFFPQPGDRMWTPSDWAWAGGLFNALLPALYFGVPTVFGPSGPSIRKRRSG